MLHAIIFLGIMLCVSVCSACAFTGEMHRLNYERAERKGDALLLGV